MTTAPTTPIVPPAPSAPPAKTTSHLVTSVGGIAFILGLYTMLSRLIFIVITFWTLHSSASFTPDHMDFGYYLYTNLPSFVAGVAGFLSSALGYCAMFGYVFQRKDFLEAAHVFMGLLALLLSSITVASRALFFPVNFWKFHAAMAGWTPDVVGLAVNLWVHLPSVVALVGGVQVNQMSSRWLDNC